MLDAFVQDRDHVVVGSDRAVSTILAMAGPERLLELTAVRALEIFVYGKHSLRLVAAVLLDERTGGDPHGLAAFPTPSSSGAP